MRVVWEGDSLTQQGLDAGGQGQSGQEAMESRDTHGFRAAKLRGVGGQRAVETGRWTQREVAGPADGERLAAQKVFVERGRGGEEGVIVE